VISRKGRERFALAVGGPWHRPAPHRINLSAEEVHMKRRGVVCSAFVLLVIVAGVALPGCGGGKTLQALDGTSVTDLPPVPLDLSKETQCATPRYSVRCAAVPSGTNNCLALLRAESEMQLARLLGESIESQVVDKGKRTSKGSDQGKGIIGEDATRSWNYQASISGNMNFRRHESPLFMLDRGQEYAMRTCVVMEEAYYQIYTDMAEGARRNHNSDLQQAFLDLREERYGDNPPDHKKVEDVESEIAQHYQALWKMTNKR
jgi:hypothetical protein